MRFRHCYLLWVKGIQSTSILILSPLLRLIVPSGLAPSGITLLSTLASEFFLFSQIIEFCNFFSIFAILSALCRHVELVGFTFRNELQRGPVFRYFNVFSWDLRTIQVYSTIRCVISSPNVLIPVLLYYFIFQTSRLYKTAHKARI